MNCQDDLWRGLDPSKSAGVGSLNNRRGGRRHALANLLAQPNCDTPKPGQLEQILSRLSSRRSPRRRKNVIFLFMAGARAT